MTLSLATETERVRVATSAEGRVDVRVRPEGGDWIRLHSLHNPEAEARGLVDRTLGGRDVPPVVAVIGVGLGFVVDEILRRRPDVRILALEAFADLLPLWERRARVGPKIASGQIVVGVEPSYDLPSAAWPASVLADEPIAFVHPALAHHWPAAVERARRAVSQFMFERRANEEARQRLAPMYLEHTLRNLPALAVAADVASLTSIAAGDPLVLCGAGPSLDRLLPALRENRDRAWYVALDTAVRPLVAAGIVPDLVVSIDPTPLNGRHLLNLPTRRRPWVVAEVSLDPRAMAAFDGRIFACRINRADPWPWLEPLGIAPTIVRAWGSVLTTACDLIARMRPAHVAFAGIDLAYTNGQPYCRGTAFEEDWEAHRVGEGHATIESVWRARLSGQTVTEPDLNGNPATTSSHMIAFRNWVRTFVLETPGCTFGNVTGAGILHGAGIAATDLRAWLDRAGARRFSPDEQLQKAATRRWDNRVGVLADAASRAATSDAEPWTTWHARVSRVDRAWLGRVLDHAARSLRAGTGAHDMNVTVSEWVDVPFDASNFFAQEPMRWEVREEGGVTYAYLVEGRTMTLSFKINHSAVIGGPKRELYLKLPANRIAARGAANAVWIGSQAVKEMGYITVHPGHDFAVVHRSNEEPFPQDDGYFFLFGQLVLEVQ